MGGLHFEDRVFVSYIVATEYWGFFKKVQLKNKILLWLKENGNGTHNTYVLIDYPHFLQNWICKISWWKYGSTYC